MSTNIRIARAAHELIHNSPRSAQQIADWLGVPINTLYKQVDPNAHGAKFGLDAALAATQFTKNLVVLNTFAAECGCMVCELPDPSGLSSVDAVGRITHLATEFADLFSALAATLTDGNVNANELARCEKEAGELMSAVQGALRHVTELHREAVDRQQRRLHSNC